MYWEANLTTTLWYTLLVSAGAALMATALGWLLAGLTSVVQILGHRLLAAILTSLVLLPLYVHATAWSAGFGGQGWFRWNQVVAVGSNSYAVMACVWIHATAALPVAFLLLQSGWRRSVDDSFWMARLDGTFVSAILIHCGRKVLPWCLLSFGLIFAWTSSEMVVTNLFQVPTITEALYQSVQFEKIRSVPLAVAIGYSIVFGLVCACLAVKVFTKVAAEDFNTREVDALPISSPVQFVGTAVAWTLVAITVGVPFLSMVAKAGGHVSMVDGNVVQTWSLRTLWEACLGLGSFRKELLWSIVLSGYSAAISVSIGIAILYLSRRVALFGCIVFGLGAAFALPGPIINQSIQWLFQRDIDWLQQLNQRTVVAPLIGLQFRTLPIVFAVLWLADRRFQTKYQFLLQLDSGAWRTRLQAMLGWIATTSVIAFFLSFANLESYLLVLPPQVTTLSLRLFELLHYGVQNTEAGVGLALTLACTIASLLLTRFMSTTAR